MKYTALLALSLATFTVAAPHRGENRHEVVITIKTGDGDAATTLTVKHDQIVSVQGAASHAVQASISDGGSVCQGYSDERAKHSIGPVFKKDSPADYSSTSNGGTSSKASDAVRVKSYLCCSKEENLGSKSNNNNNHPDYKPPKYSNGTVTANATTWAPSSAPSWWATTQSSTSLPTTSAPPSSTDGMRF